MSGALGGFLYLHLEGFEVTQDGGTRQQQAEEHWVSYQIFLDLWYSRQQRSWSCSRDERMD